MTEHRHRMAYVAYPLDQASMDRSFATYVDDTVGYMITHSVIGLAFDPGDAFKGTMTAELGPEVAALNAAAASEADVVLAFLPAGSVSIGVPIEIDRAVAAGKHVVVFSDARSWMLQYHRPNIMFTGGLSEQAVREAAHWLLAQPQATGRGERDPLPVVVGMGGTLPTRGHEDDAGLDLYVSQYVAVQPGQFMDVPCDVRTELPEWAWGLIMGRSSTLRNRGLMVQPGVIDCGWRGDLFVAVWNMTDEVVVVNQGERLGQIIVMPNLTKDLRPVHVDQLTPHPRGDNGFGSTGA